MSSILRFPSLREVSVTDSFWKEQYRRLREVTLPDTIDKFLKDGVLDNYDMVAAGMHAKHKGWPFYPGLFNEVIRAASDFLIMQYDPKLDALLDEMIAHIPPAQDADPDGFLSPFTTLERPEQRWGRNGGDFCHQHELYNAGTLAEAGVHHYRATGKTTLLRCAVRMANYLTDFIGDSPKHNCVPGHSIAEQAYIDMAELFFAEPELAESLDAHPAAYRALVQYWVDHRGVLEDRWQEPRNHGAYMQDHLPVREQKEAVGHAVRATLFYAGIESLANVTGEKALHDTAEILWHDIVDTKLHINGCVGAHAKQEAFGEKYELPNDAYLETCAGVGLIMFAYEHFRYTGEASVFDVIENTYYNTVLSSVSERGTEYFYQNPLMSDGHHERWAWHTCPCCPPMYLKAMGLLPQLIYAIGDDAVRFNLLIGSQLSEKDFTLTYTDGQLTLEGMAGLTKKIMIRIPAYARDFRLTGNGTGLRFEEENGYAVIVMRAGDTVGISYDAPIVAYAAHPEVEADIGRVAVMHGPVLYCAEGIDNGGHVDIRLSDGPLYWDGDRICGTTVDGETFRLLPYYPWDNRGSTEMAVWLRCEAAGHTGLTRRDWQGHLYLPLREY